MSDKIVLDFGRVMRLTQYHSSHKQPFHFRLIVDQTVMGDYEADTPEGIISQLRENGVEIRGSYPLDYSFPENAYEFWLWRELFKLSGWNESDIRDVLEYPNGDLGKPKKPQ